MGCLSSSTAQKVCWEEWKHGKNRPKQTKAGPNCCKVMQRTHGWDHVNCADLSSPYQPCQNMCLFMFQVPVEVDEALLKELEEMGFTTNRAKRALHGSGNSTIEGAINWITEHENDADIDEPLLVRKVRLW